MSRPSALDGIDFRPFFDMVVGILFVLLILIGALIFFQKSQSTESSDAKAAALRLWTSARDMFLDRVASDLRQKGLPARVDLAAGAVLLPLDAVTDVGPAGLMVIRSNAVADLGIAVEASVACVSVPRRSGGACAGTEPLSLRGLAVQTRLGDLPAGAGLSQDRAARFVSTLLSADLLRAAPGLLRASDSTGRPLIGFSDALTTQPGSPARPVAGELVLGFSFPEPASP